MMNTSICMSELPTLEIIRRVLNIQFGRQFGTGFAVTKSSVQFLITAKHLFGDIKNDSEIELNILTLRGWSLVKVKYHMYSNDIDIAVLELQGPRYPVTKYNNTRLSSTGVIFGQDVYFYGFPYVLNGGYATSFHSEFPIPLVKKACVSAINNDLYPNCILLDGINNPGFSGGPVTYYNNQTKSHNICGVIMGYRPEQKPVKDINIKDVENNYVMDKYVEDNSGIIIAYDIKFAVKIISRILNLDKNETEFLG